MSTLSTTLSATPLPHAGGFGGLRPLLAFGAALTIVATGLLIYTASGDACRPGAHMHVYDAVRSQEPPPPDGQPGDEQEGAQPEDMAARKSSPSGAAAVCIASPS